MADRRTMFEGVLYQLVAGCHWRHVPRHRYGPQGTVYHHFNRWRRTGVFDRLADRLRLRADREGHVDWSVLCAAACGRSLLHGTSIRASACAAGGWLSPSSAPTRASRPTTPWGGPGAGSARSSTC